MEVPESALGECAPAVSAGSPLILAETAVTLSFSPHGRITFTCTAE